MEYSKILKGIREKVFDIYPVTAFYISKASQGIFVEYKSVTSTLTIDSEVTQLSGSEKLYEFTNILIAGGIEVTSAELSNPLANISLLNSFSYTLTTEKQKIVQKNMFSDEFITEYIYKFLTIFFKNCYAIDTADIVADDSIETVKKEVESFEPLLTKKLILWVAFFLFEEKRKLLTALAKYEGCKLSDEEYINVSKVITTTVGSAFSVVETEREKGTGEQGFTVLWGDANNRLVKEQLFIRGDYERLFKDYSLRDNVIISSVVPVCKIWGNDVYPEVKNPELTRGSMGTDSYYYDEE